MKIWDKMRKTSRRITAMHRMKRRWRKKINSRMRKDEISWNKETGTISHVQQTSRQTLQLILLTALKRIINLCNQLYMHQNIYTSDISNLEHVSAQQRCNHQTSKCNGPFWGRYISYWEDSLMMASRKCRNM